MDTVGGSLARLGRQANAGVLAAVWGAAALKLIAAVLPVVAVRGLRDRRWDRLAWRLAWVAAGVLIAYGAVLTGAGLLVQAGVIHTGAHPDWRALDGHAYLWDPWFLVWGLLIAAALVPAGRRRRARAASAATSGGFR